MNKVIQSFALLVLVSITSLSVNATSLTYIGNWNVYDGPFWATQPFAYTGQEAAALLFGGDAVDYAISTRGDDENQVNFLAWYDVIGIGKNLFAQDYSNKYLDQFYGPTSGFTQDLLSNAASTYVRDNTFGLGAINYAFRVEQVNAVPLPAAAWLFGSAALGFFGLRRKNQV